ncbi:cyclic nucleotide-binding domain-containing protein [Bosea sp. RAC05]|uniref:cyclic nucleotide-binding domain-containing protein n=1 Tax=Bosea sp. RAC05 TaxID=1842539 RepID=UPI00083D1638|nr:cyclic nucleotide-binding domain-containing protein [Bosea sp. RAC05]AOG06412.1 crp-like helix-turn-helix domain protein [Bosea sp. RAC05]
MRHDEIEEMRTLPLFVGVASTHVESMLRASFLQRFPAHVELAREGDPADFLHVIIDGQIEMYSAYRDRETTISVIGPGHSFIVAAVILDRVYLKSARALLPSRVLLIPAEAVRRSFGEDAAFSRALALELAGAYRGVVRELKNQKLRSSLERLANWVLTHHGESGGTGRFELPFDKKVLASRLGMAPEVLSRSIAALVPYGVKVSGRVVEIGDMVALNGLAHPSPTIDGTVS